MVEEVPLAFVLVEVGVVVAVVEAALAGVLEVVVPIYPRFCHERRLGGHITHTAAGRRRYVLVPVGMVLPVDVVGIYVRVVDIVELARLEEVARRDVGCAACEARHILAELDDLADSAAAEREPSGAFVIDDDARVKRMRAVFCSRCLSVDQALLERAAPRADW